MKAAGLRGISRTKGPRTTLAGAGPDSRPGLVKRDFTGPLKRYPGGRSG